MGWEKSENQEDDQKGTKKKRQDVFQIIERGSRFDLLM